LAEFSPFETFESTLSHWRLVVILTLIGGLAGLLFHRLQPPVYDATVVFVIGIDYKNVGRELTQYEEDLAVGAAGGLISSTSVIEKVIAQASAQQIQIDYVEFVQSSNLERRQALWELRVRNNNPKIAQTLANIWGQQAFADLEIARHNAWQAYRIHDDLAAIKQCLNDPDFVLPVVECDSFSSGELEHTIELKEVEYNTKLQSAQGILPALLFDLSSEAFLPDKPTAYAVNLLVFSGALIGFLVGVVFSSLKAAKR
jgi:hypothetical protein